MGNREREVEKVDAMITKRSKAVFIVSAVFAFCLLPTVALAAPMSPTGWSGGSQGGLDTMRALLSSTSSGSEDFQDNNQNDTPLFPEEDVVGDTDPVGSNPDEGGNSSGDNPAAVPLPATFPLVAIGIVALLMTGRRRRS